MLDALPGWVTVNDPSAASWNAIANTLTVTHSATITADPGTTGGVRPGRERFISVFLPSRFREPCTPTLVSRSNA
jgi:hypothetical protein